MSRSQTESLLSSTQSFFQNYLRQTRGASAHTVRAYRDALKLFVFVYRVSSPHSCCRALRTNG
jgi:hypothetical protein